MAILSVRGAVPFYAVIFLNAAIDLGHKITIQNTIFKVHDGAEQIVQTAVINALILLPYILLFLPIGFIANSKPKPIIMRSMAFVSLLLTLCIAVFYWKGYFWLAFASTFLMSIQSAFYSPAKLAYLKVMFGERQLSAANGLAQAVTITGILVATLFFSIGFECLFSFDNLSNSTYQSGLVSGKNNVLSKADILPSMLLLACVLVAMSVLQITMIYRVPILPEASLLKKEDEPIHKIKLAALLKTKSFIVPVMGLSLFWAVGQGLLAVFPAYAKAYAGINNTAIIQGVLACVAIGIALGGVIVARCSANKIRLDLAVLGMLLMLLGMACLTHLQHAWQFALNYLLLGIASGMLLVPLNAYLQLKASANNIGSVIASSNLLQNIAMLLMLIITMLFAWQGIDSLLLLQCMTIFVLLATLLIGRKISKLN